MIDVREIPHGSTGLAAEAMLALRPRWGSPAAVVDVIDTQLRPVGYRLVGVFRDRQMSAVAVAGFRKVTALAWGLYVYVDDISTLPGERGVGHADRLMNWLGEEGQRLGCEGLHLDSGVAEDRAPAHRLYMRHKLRISAHHFQRDL
ncbi:MAG TPA: GNAT family N-acetyltransferase [Mycobacteriales bacterium]|jgi:GNAT superfamily N-acetyltransferase|nr:GNAT family N-acetyltransferase [Mycobacteriales bacterium]